MQQQHKETNKQTKKSQDLLCTPSISIQKQLPGVYTERSNIERLFFRKSNLAVQQRQNQMKTKLSRSSGLARALHFSFETEQDWKLGTELESG